MNFFTVDADRCDGNGACVEECPIYLLAQPEPGAPPIGIEGAEDACFNCGHCVAVCPHEAISYHGARTGKSMRPEGVDPDRQEAVSEFRAIDPLVQVTPGDTELPGQTAGPGASLVDRRRRQICTDRHEPAAGAVVGARHP